jgi:hypothetical protein
MAPTTVAFLAGFLSGVAIVCLVLWIVWVAIRHTEGDSKAATEAVEASSR